MKRSDEYVLLDYEFSQGRKKLKMILTYFNSVPKVDIREYYFDEDDETFKHTKKGVQLDPQKAEALRSALEENAAIIDKHLVSEDLAKWASQVKCIESSDDFFSDYEFFRTRSTGGKEEVIFNTNHPFGKRLSDLKDRAAKNPEARELLHLINCLLLGYQNSMCQFDEDAKTRIGDFSQDLNQLWGSLIRRMLGAKRL